MRQRLGDAAFLLDRWLHDRDVPGFWWCDLFERIIWWGNRAGSRYDPLDDHALL